MKPTFRNLWNSYPREKSPCEGPWINQCAIRLSIALNTEGSITLNNETYSEPKCKHGHARGAETLANWLWKYHLGHPKIFKSGAEAKKQLKGKQGIIFFKDCFTRPNETERRGDHIDLWQAGSTKSYNDPNNNSKQVWFWELV